jgi:UDP-N-acetylglucosamine acyltransferase
MIHPTAIVDSRAKLPSSCKVGPYCVVGPEVELGENCELGSHVVIDGPAKIGSHNRFFSFCAIATDPQDISFAGEKTWLRMGDHNVIREYATLNRGTGKGGGAGTAIGNHVLIMAYAHVGHDCVIQDHSMLINGATLAGHVTVEEWAVVGALCPVHQFVRIGAHAYIGGGTTITKDVLPFAKAVTPRNTRTYGLNAIGLERRGFSKERIRKIHHVFHVLLNSKLNTTQALERLRAEDNPNEDLRLIIEFVEASERGVIKR